MGFTLSRTRITRSSWPSELPVLGKRGRADPARSFGRGGRRPGERRRGDPVARRDASLARRSGAPRAVLWPRIRAESPRPSRRTAISRRLIAWPKAATTSGRCCEVGLTPRRACRPARRRATWDRIFRSKGRTGDPRSASRRGGSPSRSASAPGCSSRMEPTVTASRPGDRRRSSTCRNSTAINSTPRKRAGTFRSRRARTIR